MESNLPANIQSQTNGQRHHPSRRIILSTLLFVYMGFSSIQVLAEDFEDALYSVVDSVDTIRVRLSSIGDLYMQRDLPGTNVNLAFDSITSPQQIWHMEKLDGMVWRFIPSTTGGYLRATSENGWLNCNNVVLASWNNWDSQKWGIAWCGGGLVNFNLTGVDYQLCANSGSDGWGAGDNVEIYEPMDWGSEKWDISTVENLDSPSIIKAPNGNLVVYLKYNNNSDSSSVGKLYTSDDGGATWDSLPDLPESYGTYAPTLFTHDGDLYMLSCEGYNLILRKSINSGSSWTKTVLNTFGQLLESGGGAPVLVHDGYVYYGFMDKDYWPVYPIQWPRYYRLRVASCSTSVDITNPSNWTITTPEAFPSYPAVSGTENGWLEPNLVPGPDGKIWLIARVDHQANGNVAACLKLNSARTDIEFNNIYPATGLNTGFFTAGWAGSAKFHIIYDDVSSKYWVMSNPYRGAPSTNTRHPYVRNVLALYSSTDLKNYILEDDLIEDDISASWAESAWCTGFQQPAFIIDGSHLLYVSRTAYGTFDDYHDANMITFHKKLNFR